MKDLNGDDGTYTKVKITVEKFKNGESGETDAAKLANQAGSGNAVESIEISKADFASKHLTDTTGLHKHGNRLSRMFMAVSIEFR